MVYCPPVCTAMLATMGAFQSELLSRVGLVQDRFTLHPKSVADTCSRSSSAASSSSRASSFAPLRQGASSGTSSSSDSEQTTSVRRLSDL